MPHAAVPVNIALNCCMCLLQIGVRCDSAFISIYDASGTEVENAELLFCEEGTFTHVSVKEWTVTVSD